MGTRTRAHLSARRRAVGFAAILLVALILALLDAQALPAPPRPAYGPANLYGAIIAPGPGWGFTSGSVSNPGPTISVAPGENVQLWLYSPDSLTHIFFVDYNHDNNSQPPSEPESPQFSSPSTPVSFNFVATTTPGGYWYSCKYHGWF